MKYVLLALTTLCLIGACKKVETPKSQAQKLRDSNWEPNTLTMTYFNYVGGDSDMVYKWEKKKHDEPNIGGDTRPECIKDDKLEFKLGNDGVHQTGANKCVSSELNLIDFKWGLSENDTKMYIYGLFTLLGVDANGYLQELSDDKFVFVYPGQVKDGTGKDIPVKYTLTFNKK